jgi:beta-glucanase (GH16 family)
VPPRFTFQYGYVEVRARVPAGQGLWPAIWLLPASHQSRPEIDIMEVLGHDPNTLYMVLHYNDAQGNRQRSMRESNVSDLSQDWHVYAVRWTPEEVRWYLDGQEMRNFTRAQQLPHEPMYLLINLAVGGDWPGSPDEATRFPSVFLIDYVRIWTPSGADLPGR